LLIRYFQDIKPYPDEKTDKELAAGAQPGRLTVLEDPDWQNKYPLLKGLAFNLPYASYKWGLIPENPEIMMNVGIEVHEALFGDKTVKQALDDAAAKMHDIFEASGRYE
jgi:ABC-type glycerol-3-phosphate transport system substrate-binding protein